MTYRIAYIYIYSIYIVSYRVGYAILDFCMAVLRIAAYVPLHSILESQRAIVGSVRWNTIEWQGGGVLF